MALKPTIKIMSPKRFRLQQELQQKDRQNEQWTRARLIDETYLSLMSVKEKNKEGILRRKYVEQVRREMGWLIHGAVIKVSLADLDDKIREELSKDDQASREFTLKEAVGKICEVVDSRTYLINAMPFLKVELVE